MKKLLALVLALVMVLSLCTVTNAAYPDAADIDYEEAVDVMSAVGVFQGDEKGNFNPDAILTRETAAKLIAYLDLGEKTAEALPAVKVFSDVEANRWSAKYVAYCADAGYIAGVGDGSYNPTGELTGYAFGKLLLCVLGYDAAVEGFTGANWSIAVAKLMDKNDIADGVDTAASAALSREAAAQYCLNTLKADCVEYDNGGTTITTGDVTITTGASKAEPVANGADDDYMGREDDKVQQLVEKLYADLTLDTESEDAFGRPAAEWADDEEPIGTYADTADKSFTATESASEDVLAQINDDLGLKKDSSKLETAQSYKFLVNGKAAETEELVKGDAVELFLDDEGDIKLVAIIRDELGQVKVTEQKASKKVGAYTLYEVGEEDGKVFSTVVDEDKDVDDAFVTGEVANEDYVLYHTDNEGNLYLKLAETVEGKITATKGDDVKIDGTYYGVAEELTANKGDEGTWALNAAGELGAAIDVTTTSDDYALIYNVVDNEGEKNEDGFEDDGTWTAYLVLADGTKKSYTLNVDFLEDEDFAEDYEAADDLIGEVVAYSVNKDGELVIEKAAGKIDEADVTVSKDSAKLVSGVYSNAETTFVFVDFETEGEGEAETLKKVTVDSVVTGYKNVKVAAEHAYFAYDEETKYASVVFVCAENGTDTSDVMYAVMLDSEAVETLDEDDETLYTYTVMMDGEETELTVDAELDLEDGAVFSFKMTGTTAEEVEELTETAEATVVNEDYVVIGDEQYTIADDAEIYVVTEDDDEFTVTEGSIAEEDLVIIAKADENKIEIAFVIELEEEEDSELGG